MAAPVFQSSTSFSSTFAASITRALNAGSGANRCVLVFATNQSSNSTVPASATYGGIAMTAGSLQTCTAVGNQGRLFWLFGDGNVASGSNNIVVTYSNGNGKPDIVAVAYNGVDGSSGVRNLVTNTGLSGAPNWNVSSAAGDIAVALWTVTAGGAIAPTSPTVARFSEANGSNVLDNVAWERAGAASVSVSGTIAGPTPAWFGSAVSLAATSAGPATAITLSGPSSGTVGVASGNFTAGANGTLSASVLVTPSDSGAGGSFAPASVTISSGTPTATFAYTAASAGSKTISVANNGGLSNPAALSYNATTSATGSITTEPICNNTGTLLVSQSGATVYVYSVANGALVVTKTGQTTNGAGVMTITDAAISAGTTYRIVGVLSGGAEFMARYTAA